MLYACFSEPHRTVGFAYGPIRERYVGLGFFYLLACIEEHYGQSPLWAFYEPYSWEEHAFS